jgi:AcrR family transcriptional regulator
MEAIAERAGVRRATVYNHFPTDVQLLDACSSHWFGQNPPPDPANWAEISDPAKRVRIALESMYEYYDNGREMLENVLRDTPQVPALQDILRQKWFPLLEMMVSILAEAWNGSGQCERDGDMGLKASLRVVLDFFTWQTMSESGLSNVEAATLAASWIEAGSKTYPSR